MMMTKMMMKMLLMMTMKTQTSFLLLLAETPHGWPDIMQVMLLSLQAAYAQKMCSIDGVTCGEKKNGKG